MTSINLIVNGSKARAEVDGILTAGSIGIPVTIQYDSTWDGLTKHLVCTSGKWGPTGKPKTMLNVETASTVAHEVMVAENHLYIGVEGCNAAGNLVIRTIWADCGTIFPGAKAGADLSTMPTMPIWAQLQAQINDLKKNTDSIENAEHGSSNTAVLTSTQTAALDELFKVCAFTKADISAEYNEFKSAFGLTDSGGTGDSEGSSETISTYTVTNNLTNVTTDSTVTEVTEGGSYSANLTIADGYMLESLVITHNGEDVTDAVYGEGYILITNISGDIVITAVAAEPEYVDIATGISTDTVKLYSDTGITAIATKYYQTGAYSLNRTETDAKVKVVLTNNTESAISSTNVYIGSTDEQAIRNPNSTINVHHAISGSKGSVVAGASVEIEYTVRAGYWAYVCGYGDLSVSIVGVLDVRKPVDAIETASKYIDTFTVYSDAGVTQIGKTTYRTAYVTTKSFDSDTELLITVVSSGNGGDILYGGVESGTLTANVSAHYGDTKVVKNFATGATLIFTCTVKAGYYFAILPCLSSTFYIEKA